MLISHLLTIIDRVSPPGVVHAHCDLPCGVYDPAQARIEAESVHMIQQKYQDSDDPEFKERAIQIKEERADLVYAFKIRVPEEPGLGIDLNVDVARAHPYDPNAYLSIFTEGWEKRIGGSQAGSGDDT